MSFRYLILLASLLLLSIHGGVFFYTLHQIDTGIDRELVQHDAQLKRNFEFALHEQEMQTLLLASMVANDPQVQWLFYQGKNAVEREGGGPGGTESQRLRSALYQHVAPSWMYLQKTYGLRQLHFHLGPGSLSYLRVHVPNKFGDRMDNLRHIIVDVNADQQRRSGFETGRIYSGVRGVVPVWYKPAGGAREYVGALEAGSSMEMMAEDLGRVLGGGFAILLRSSHVEDAVWNAFRPQLENFSDCHCYLETYSDPLIKDWLQSVDVPRFSPSVADSATLQWNGRRYYLSSIPVYDYRGIATGNNSSVGNAIAWHDVTALYADKQDRARRFLLIMLGSYLLTQALLLAALQRLRRALQQTIDSATAKLEEAHSQLDTLLACSPIVTYRVSVPGQTPDYVSANVEQLLGVRPQEILATKNWWLSEIHPLDLPRVKDTLDWRQWPDSFITRRYRLRRRQGGWLWVEDRCRAIYQHDRVVRLNGVLIDITAQVETEEALVASERRLTRAQEVARVGSWEYMPEDQSLRWSLETYRIFGVDPQVKPNYTLLLEIVHPDDREQMDQAWQAALQGADYDVEHRILVNGELRWVREVAELERDDSGLLQATGVVEDITERKARELELKRLASTDVLTGLPNRRLFMLTLQNELARVHRYNGLECCLLMLDLDHFKQVNDRFGHAAGDQVLQAFASVAEGCLRDSDIIGRLGGEEFAALLPSTGLKGGQVLAERMRRAVSHIALENVPGLKISVSIGLVALSQRDDKADAALSRADKALYQAKASGRDRVVTGTQPEELTLADD